MSGDPDGSTSTDGSDANPAPGPEEVQCDADVAAPKDGVCDATTGQGTALIVRGNVLGESSVYLNGSVVIEEGKITCVGCDCEAPADATHVDCKGQVISPGLINAHDHITFTEGAPIDHGATRYNHRHDWRGSLSAPQNSHGKDGTTWGELRMLFSGVTSIVGSGGTDGLIRNLDRLTPEDEADGLSFVEFETFSLGDSNEEFHENCTWKYKFDENEVAEFSAFMPHVAEGIDEYAQEEFRCQSSSFDGGQDFTEKNSAHIHSIGLSAADYYRMARFGTKLIWSPRSNISLYGHTAQVTAFARLGGTIALGTDWTYSGSANILRELACADGYNQEYLDGYFSDRDLWKMVTANAAEATGNAGKLGVLKAGALADISVFKSNGKSAYRAVLEADTKSVALVLKNGNPLYGEGDVVKSLDGSCESVDVCGTMQGICASRELGQTYAAIAAAVNSGKAPYPAVFCEGVPDNEPTCIPSRPGEFSGEISADDNDGDGIKNSADNCANVFNPIRPIDNAAQLDTDGDGEGDPCDDSPIGEDLDSDGIANDGDNCPLLSNAEQTDGDQDLKGDSCDFCPAVSNPEGVCGEGPAMDATIYAVQMATVGVGTHVKLAGVVVTSVWNLGMTVQDPAGGAYSGISVFTGSGHGVVVGDVVDVDGDVTEYFSDTEIENATLTKVGTSMTLVGAPLTAAEAATEEYEGVLVQITDATKIDETYDCAVDGACTDPLLWEINDAVVVWNRSYQGTDWETVVKQGPVTGVMAFRFDRRRIMPRTAADIGQ